MSAALDLHAILLRLQAMPAELRAAAQRMGESAWRVTPPNGGFSLVEQAWHLADLEREGYGLRIERLLSEEGPFLPNFDGDRIAAERDYRRQSMEEGLAAFAAARAQNLTALRALPAAAWDRSGTQEGVGPITLRDVPRLMLDHDDAHREEIAALSTINC